MTQGSSKTALHQIAIDAWEAGTALLVFCAILETVDRGFVSRFFNLLWLLLFIISTTFFVLATHPGPNSEHRYGGGVKALLRLASLAVAAAVWLFLPESLRLFWRALATGSILLAGLLAWPAFGKNE